MKFASVIYKNYSKNISKEMYQTIKTALEEGICVITINRPEKMNALNKDVIEELGKALEDVYNNEEIKSAIITGEGAKAFVAGADITEFTDLDAKGGAALAQIGQDKVFSKIENSPKPIVAAVNGFALGGGCELAMACHFRTASETARFGQPEVNLGLIPGYGGTQRLVQLIGKGKAMELLMTADMIKADEAKALGLVNHVFAAEELIAKTKEILVKIQTKAPLALAKVIALVNEAATASDTGLSNEVKAFGECFGTEDKKRRHCCIHGEKSGCFHGEINSQ